MNIQDLTNNRDRIISKIKFQISLATEENIKSVMAKMVAMLPLFINDKATKANIDKLTTKALISYLKHDIKFTTKQGLLIDARIAENKTMCLPSNLQ